MDGKCSPSVTSWVHLGVYWVTLKGTFSYLHSLKRAGDAVFSTPVDNPKYSIGGTINFFTKKVSKTTKVLEYYNVQNATSANSHHHEVGQAYVALISTVSSSMSV